jgi:excisionase family DNA binding protein
MSFARTDSPLTAAELSERLGVKPGTILDWHRKGRIPARKLSHKVLRFDLADVLSALEKPPTPRHEPAGPREGQ